MTVEKPVKLWPVLITTMFASFMNPFMLAAVNIGLPDIQNDFNCSATTLSWITNSFLLANAIVLLPLSKAADIWGRVRFFKMGLYLFTLFSLLSGLSSDITMLLTMRIFQGAGAALMHVTGVAILTESYPSNKRGFALGINIGAVYAGLSMGPFIGGLLTQLGGWSLIFLAVVPLGLFTIVLSHLNLRNVTNTRNKTSFDINGSLLYATAIFAFIYGGGKIRTSFGLILFIMSIALIVIFFLHQKRIKSPILSVDLLKNNKRFTYSNIAALIHYSSTFGIGFLLSLYLQFSKGLSPGEAGLVLVIQPLIMVVTAPLTGRLSDRINPRYLASTGLLLTFAALVALLVLKPDTSTAYISMVLAMFGLGFGLFTSPNTNAVMGSVERKDYGIASGINATMRVFGQTISMMVVTILISVFLENESITTENIGLFLKSMKFYLILFSILSLVGLWFSMQRDRTILVR